MRNWSALPLPPPLSPSPITFILKEFTKCHESFSQHDQVQLIIKGFLRLRRQSLC